MSDERETPQDEIVPERKIIPLQPRPIGYSAVRFDCVTCETPFYLLGEIVAQMVRRGEGGQLPRICPGCLRNDR